MELHPFQGKITFSRLYKDGLTAARTIPRPAG